MIIFIITINIIIIIIIRLSHLLIILRVMMQCCRFKYEGIWRDKITAHVDFPVERLDMSRYISGPMQRAPYNLFAVSVCRCSCFLCYNQLLYYLLDTWVTRLCSG